MDFLLYLAKMKEKQTSIQVSFLDKVANFRDFGGFLVNTDNALKFNCKQKNTTFNLY